MTRRSVGSAPVRPRRGMSVGASGGGSALSSPAPRMQRRCPRSAAGSTPARARTLPALGAVPPAGRLGGGHRPIRATARNGVLWLASTSLATASHGPRVRRGRVRRTGAACRALQRRPGRARRRTARSTVPTAFTPGGLLVGRRVVERSGGIRSRSAGEKQPASTEPVAPPLGRRPWARRASDRPASPDAVGGLGLGRRWRGQAIGQPPRSVGTEERTGGGPGLPRGLIGVGPPAPDPSGSARRRGWGGPATPPSGHGPACMAPRPAENAPPEGGGSARLRIGETVVAQQRASARLPRSRTASPPARRAPVDCAVRRERPGGLGPGAGPPDRVRRPRIRRAPLRGHGEPWCRRRRAGSSKLLVHQVRRGPFLLPHVLGLERPCRPQPTGPVSGRRPGRSSRLSASPAVFGWRPVRVRHRLPLAPPWVCFT